MDAERREILKAGGAASALALAIAAGFLRPRAALAQSSWNKAAFESKSFAEAARALGATGVVESAQVRFVSPTPDISENGAMVPVTVTSGLPRTQSISILVARNPNALAASFDIAEGTEAFVSTRLKMAETSDVYALVKADGKYYFAKKEIAVTIGGCGS